jgi:hypothetical protein
MQDLKTQVQIKECSYQRYFFKDLVFSQSSWLTNGKALEAMTIYYSLSTSIPRNIRVNMQNSGYIPTDAGLSARRSMIIRSISRIKEKDCMRLHWCRSNRANQHGDSIDFLIKDKDYMR